MHAHACTHDTRMHARRCSSRIVDAYDGLHHGTYKLYVGGSYSLHVTHNREHIYGSPFKLVVPLQVEAEFCIAQGAAFSPLRQMPQVLSLHIAWACDLLLRAPSHLVFSWPNCSAGAVHSAAALAVFLDRSWHCSSAGDGIDTAIAGSPATFSIQTCSARGALSAASSYLLESWLIPPGSASTDQLYHGSAGGFARCRPNSVEPSLDPITSVFFSCRGMGWQAGIQQG